MGSACVRTTAPGLPPPPREDALPAQDVLLVQTPVLQHRAGYVLRQVLAHESSNLFAECAFVFVVVEIHVRPRRAVGKGHGSDNPQSGQPAGNLR